jgi:hypothetical protein
MSGKNALARTDTTNLPDITDEDLPAWLPDRWKLRYAARARDLKQTS